MRVQHTEAKPSQFEVAQDMDLVEAEALLA